SRRGNLLPELHALAVQDDAGLGDHRIGAPVRSLPVRVTEADTLPAHLTDSVLRADILGAVEQGADRGERQAGDVGVHGDLLVWVVAVEDNITGWSRRCQAERGASQHPRHFEKWQGWYNPYDQWPLVQQGKD